MATANSTATAEELATIPDPLEIPLALDTPLYEQRVTLDGIPFLFLVDYNGREDRWYLSLFTQDRVPLASGIKLVANQFILRRHRGREGFPPGDLMTADYSDQRGASPGFQELGRRVRLLYFPLVVKVETLSELAPEEEPPAF
jgi:hypothetical protein